MSLGRTSISSTSCSSSFESSEAQDRGPLPYGRQVYNRGSSCTPLVWNDQLCSPFSNLPSYGQDSDTDSSLSSVGDCTLALAGLRGSVSQGDPCFAGPFCKAVERDVREDEEELSATSSVINEGIIFYNDVGFTYIRVSSLKLPNF